MLLLEAGNIKKYYADRLILELEDLKIHTGDRIGIVGMNGSGKTTLLDILSGSLEPDEGYVRHYCEIGYIRQFTDGTGTGEKTGTGADHGKQGDNNTVAVGGAEYESGYECGLKSSQKLLKEFDVGSKLQREELSGGEHTRLKIANALAKENVLLFADEPTSNLDYRGISLLRQKLESLDSFLLISHDRTLLDSLCNRILEVRDGRIRVFRGNYTYFRQQCELEREQAAAEYEKYTDEKESLVAAISNRQSRAKSIRKAPRRMGNSEARLHKRSANEAQEKLHSSVSGMITRLEKLELKEKPRELPRIRLDFSLTDPPVGKVVLSADKLDFCYGTVRIFEDTAFHVLNGKKTALWGENGTGKTTLLNLIHTGENPCIRIAPKARLAYFRQGFENLDNSASVLDNVMSDSVQKETVVRTILARLLIQGDAVYKKVGVLSGGERIKAAFAKMFVSGANVLLLDEPTNYLDMQSIEALEAVLKEYEGTVLFVSHDRSFVNSVADRLLVLGNHSIRDFDGKLEDYEVRYGNRGWTEEDTGRNPSGSNGTKDSSAGRNTGKSASGISDSLERTMLQMKLTETIAKLSAQNGNKEALESEYQRLVELLRQA